jgi:hypothetical protein
MDASTLIVTLALVTLIAVVIFAMRSQQQTLRRKADPDAPKSTLASDAPGTTPDGKGQP